MSLRLMVSALGVSALLGTGLYTGGCGDGGTKPAVDKDRSNVTTLPDGAVVDTGSDSESTRGDPRYVPAPQTLPAPPPDGASSVFFSADNPVIYLNDYPRSVYVEAYIYALASNREIDLRGIISSGVDCECNAGDNYPITNTPTVRAQWIKAARQAGFKNIPDAVDGTQGARLVPPASGVYTDTAQLGSAGSALIVREANLATPERPLLIIAGGPITTLADAYLHDPSITSRVVVSWLVGVSDESLNDWNGDADKWATQLVMSRFRVYAFPSDRDPPHVPEARMRAEFPPGDLLSLLLDAGYYKEDYDSDGQPAVAVMLPSFVETFQRRGLTDDLMTIPAPDGNITVMTRGDAAAGGEEFFRALKRAYREATPLPAEPASDAGVAVAADGGR
jgi:hypothetical protein